VEEGSEVPESDYLPLRDNSGTELSLELVHRLLLGASGLGKEDLRAPYAPPVPAVQPPEFVVDALAVFPVPAWYGPFGVPVPLIHDLQALIALLPGRVLIPDGICRPGCKPKHPHWRAHPHLSIPGLFPPFRSDPLRVITK